MPLLSLSALPLLAALLAAPAEAPAPAPPAAKAPATAPSSKTVSLPFYRSDKRMLVMMRIRGGAPAPVVFDTGTNGNVLDTDYAASINAPNVGPSQSIDGVTNKPIPGYTTFLTGVTLGGVAIADGPATVFDYKRRDEIGVFGPNSFPDRYLELDFQKSRIRSLAKTPENRPTGAGTPYFDGLPVISITLNGVTFDALLDTGNDVPLTLPMAMAERLPLKTKLEVAGKTRSAGGSHTAYEAQIDGDVTVGPVTLKSPIVVFTEDSMPNVGLPVLMQLKLVFDHTGQRSWFMRIDNP